MFSRSMLRVAGRQAIARPVTIRPAFSAGFKTTAKKNDPETVQEAQVPVVSYQGGERITEELKVGTNSSGPVAPPGADAERTATPMSPQAYKHLTPTLAKFTLPNKVAIVTG